MKKLFMFGLFNSVWMYLIYPINRLLGVMSDFVGSLFTLVFLFIEIIHIICNILLYYKFIKNNEKNLKSEWLIISKGGVIGSIVIMIVLLCISATKTFQNYTYINCPIPFHLNKVEDLKYFLFVLIYSLFLYELSKKVYIFLNRKISCGD